MKTKDEVMQALKNGAVLIANEDKLVAHIHESGQLKEKIHYNHYLDIYHTDVLVLKSVTSDTHKFTYGL